MLKRYDIWALDHHELAVEEDEDGEWVKWEDVKHLVHVDEYFSYTQGTPD